MRAWPVLLAVMVGLVGCEVIGPVKPVATRSERPPAFKVSPAPSSEALATTPLAPSLAPVIKSTLTDARKTELLNGIRNAVAASRASRITSTLSDASGVLSNNGASIISDHGGGIIGQEPFPSVISDNGGGYRVLQAGAVNTDGSPDDFFTPIHFESETKGLIYIVDAPSPSTGGFKTYDIAGYKSLPIERREEALVDSFIWDDVVVTQSYGGDPQMLAWAYKLKKVSSKRIPFADRMTATQIYRMEFDGTKIKSVAIGWEISFAMDFALLGTEREQADFTAIAGENDMVVLPGANGTTLEVPVNLALTGKNSRGEFLGGIENQDKVSTQVTHTTPTGRKTLLTMANGTDGKSTQTIELPESGLRLVADLDAQGAGTGRLEDTLSAMRIGGVTWDAEGVATITLVDGVVLQARLF